MTEEEFCPESGGRERVTDPELEKVPNSRYIPAAGAVRRDRSFRTTFCEKLERFFHKSVISGDLPSEVEWVKEVGKAAKKEKVFLRKKHSFVFELGRESV